MVKFTHFSYESSVKSCEKWNTGEKRGGAKG